MNLEPHVAGDGVVFADSFWSPATVMSQNGVIVAANVSRGISPTGASGRVTYVGTESLLINATQMTVEVRFRTPSVFPPAAAKGLIAKAPQALGDNQWFVQFATFPALAMFVCNAPGDFANLFYMDPMLANTEYVAHLVYNGGLAVGSRGLIYLQGLPVATTITGTLPAAMRASASPVTVLNRDGGAAAAMPTDFILRSFRVMDRALSPAECLDAAVQITNKRITA